MSIFEIQPGIHICESEKADNYICTYNDISFNLICVYSDTKYNEFSNKIYDINYQFELLLKNEKNDKRHKIFLWIVSICEYLSHKDEKDYNHFDKVLTIIIGEVYELFNR